MTLEKHIVDTMKEWQIKIGSFDSNIRLYYPKVSLCRHLGLEDTIENEKLREKVEQYLLEIQYLGAVNVSKDGDRYCIMIDKSGCDYVEKNIEEPEFLVGFLNVLKKQKMQDVINYFAEYALKNNTELKMEKEEHGVVLYFENEKADAYMYCIDENEFGITYHRFTREDYEGM